VEEVSTAGGHEGRKCDRDEAVELRLGAENAHAIESKLLIKKTCWVDGSKESTRG